MMRSFRTYSPANKYRVYVTWVDHGTYVKDSRMEPALISRTLETGRNIHITGFRLDGAGDPFKDSVLIPQELQGSFKVPQIGDIIVVEEDYRGLGSSPVYVYSTYNDLSLDNDYASPIPAWGGMPGDHGHLRSHLDHTSQFSSNASNSFTKKFIKSVTGYRFRKYYGHVYGTKERHLDSGKFAVRGDNVFDVSKGSPLMSAEEINTEKGIDIVAVDENSLSTDQADYPNPLNVPKFRERNDKYVYISYVPRYLHKQVEADPYKSALEETVNPVENLRYKVTLKNKNYLAYQPIVDKAYFEYLQGIAEDEEGNKPNPFERELPAAEEYQVALRGNNKLLIQDQYGDGEQLLITLKNQYDSGFTVLHNKENSQVRVRDHLGQGVLLDGNPSAPRVVSWTSERQVLDMGSIRSFDPESGDTQTYGEYVYIRNGRVYGKSDTSFGRIPDNEIPRDGSSEFPVPQQEIVMINAENADGLGKLLEGLSSRMSTGLGGIVSSGPGNGIFMRNNFDPKETDQYFYVANDFSEQPVLKSRMYQEHRNPLNQKTIYTDLIQTVDDTQSKYEYLQKYQTPSTTATFTIQNTANDTYVSGGTNQTFISGPIQSIRDELYYNDANTSEMSKANSYISPAGTSVYSETHSNDSSKSRSQVSNMFTGKSMITVSREARITGFAEEIHKNEDLLTLNETEFKSNTELNTSIVQKEAGLTINSWEMTPSSVVTTQYGDPDVPNNKVEQTNGLMEFHRLQPGVSIAIGSQDSGAGSISIGKFDDVVTINSDEFTLNGASFVQITSPSVDIDPS